MAVIVKRLIYPVSVGGSGSTAKFTRTFETTDWVLSGSDYVITISATTHGIGVNPNVTVYFDNGGSFEEVEIEVLVDEAGNVQIVVSAVPDNRFKGKVTII